MDGAERRVDSLPPSSLNRPVTDQAESRALRVVRDLIESGRPLAYFHSAEERRITELLHAAATTVFKPAAPLWIWTLTDGMRRDGAKDAKPLAPRAALDFIAAHEGPGIFMLKDFHEPLRESAEIRRRLRDVHELAMGGGKLVVISSAVKFIPDEIERSIVYVEFAVPDLPELVAFLRSQKAATGA